MRVLLLGGTGLLGHNVLRRLIDEGHDVVALVRRADGIKMKEGRWQTVVGSLLDYETISRTAEGCDAIINCAGVTDMSLPRLEDYLPVNRDLPQMLVRVAKEHGIRRLVHTSTVNTIGRLSGQRECADAGAVQEQFLCPEQDDGGTGCKRCGVK